MLRYTPKFKSLAEANKVQSKNGFTLTEYIKGGPFDLTTLQLNKKTKMSDVANALPKEIEEPSYIEILKTWFDIEDVKAESSVDGVKQQAIIKHVFVPDYNAIEREIRKENPRPEGMPSSAYESMIAGKAKAKYDDTLKEMNALNVTAEQVQREYPRPDGMPENDYRAMIAAKVQVANRGTIVAGITNAGKPGVPATGSNKTSTGTGTNNNIAQYMLEGNPTAETTGGEVLPKYPNVFAFAIAWLGIQFKQIGRYFAKTPAGAYKFMDKAASAAVHKANFEEDEKLKLAYEASFKGTEKESLIPVSLLAKHSTSAAPEGIVGISAYLTSKFGKIKDFFTSAKVEPEHIDALNALKVDFSKSAEECIIPAVMTDDADKNASIRAANGLATTFKNILTSPITIGGVAVISVYEIFKRACPDWNERLQSFIDKIKQGVKNVVNVFTDAFSRVKMRNFERAKKSEIDRDVALTFDDKVRLEGFDEDLCMPVGEGKLAQFTMLRTDFDEAMRAAKPSANWRFDVGVVNKDRHIVTITQNGAYIGHAVIYGEVTDVTVRL